MTTAANTTRKQLYEKAKSQDIAGRASLTKEQLSEALEEAREQPHAAVASRLDAFSALARASAAGEFVMLPRSLTGHDRRQHVRQCLREDHETRIARHSDDAQVKFDKLADSMFAFFRGTALLFYRDMAGDDAWMPTVLTLGDVHPENFGVMPDINNVPIFSVNDFDEAYYAPFTWDIKRGAVGFMVAADEEAGYGRKRQRKIARRFVQGYIDGIRHFANQGTEQDDEMRLDTAPELIVDLIKDADENRAKWLRKDYLNEQKTGFKASKKLVPVSHRREEFQQITHRLIEECNIDVPQRAGNMHVKDVAIRRGQGTGSLGLNRYYLLIEGPNADGSDDLILEYKQARRSALTGLVPPNRYERKAQGDRIVHAQAVQLVRGDRFYGTVEFDGLSYLSRERAPFRDDIDLDDLSKSEWKEYARICGWVLAHAHALSDEAGDIDYDIEPTIIQAIGAPALFLDDMIDFADEAAERLRRDHEMFRKDHQLGAFSHRDLVYR